jgi:hypothetical protein
MKRLLFFIIAVAVLSSCSKNKIVGTWITDYSDSYSGKTVQMNMGIISNVTFENSGKYINSAESQLGINGSGGSFINFKSEGTWEMPSKDKIIITLNKQSVNGIESENSGTLEWSVLSLTDDELIVMSKGEKTIYKRKE